METYKIENYENETGKMFPKHDVFSVLEIQNLKNEKKDFFFKDGEVIIIRK